MYILIASVSEFTNIHVPPRMEILNKLLTMHMHGFHHSDFAERNVVLGPQGHRIIDLERMYEHHCLWERGRFLINGCGDFPCRDLRSAGGAMRIWRKGI